LASELAAVSHLAAGAPLSTIFVGGGTPSLLRPDLWQRLLAALHAQFDMSRMGTGGGEFTVECNPETVTPELLKVLSAGGVNRVSVGAQSFESRHLKTLERWHDPANVVRALELARDAGIARQNIDLIFGVPGQTLDEWHHDLDRAISLGTEHISCYSLTYEPRTEMTARLKRGEFAKIDDDTDAAMFEATRERLGAAGLVQYEVSNYAKPEAECRHNLAYWRQEQWIAAGPSASGHIGGHRYKNTPRLDDYLSISEQGFAPIVEHEAPDAHQALLERLMTGLRIAEGMNLEQVLRDVKSIAPACEAQVRAVVAACVADGRLRVVGDRLCPTASGLIVADAIAIDFFSALEPPHAGV
jgi:oxygen-independent coproporphyrinogen-3 oxidase